MNKVYCNKETNMVEQILKVETYDELPDDYFSNCYAVIDEEEIINGYNVKYNKETNEFEIVSGLKPKTETVIEESEEKNKIKQLTEELELTQTALNEILMNLGGI